MFETIAFCKTKNVLNMTYITTIHNINRQQGFKSTVLGSRKLQTMPSMRNLNHADETTDLHNARLFKIKHAE